MYRSGWGTKENQELTLAVRITRLFWEEMLAQAVASSFFADLHESHEVWQKQLSESEVRSQWDPDHSPRGAKLARRAIQIGIRGGMLRRYATEALEIQDISSFVAEQRQLVQAGKLDELITPRERVYWPDNEGIVGGLSLSKSA